MVGYINKFTNIGNTNYHAIITNQLRNKAKEKRSVSDLQVREIRRLKKLGKSGHDIATIVGTSVSIVYMVLSGRTYSDVI